MTNDRSRRHRPWLGGIMAILLAAGGCAQGEATDARLRTLRGPAVATTREHRVALTHLVRRD